MNKYISFLLAPIMLFGVSNNSCYSMEIDEQIVNSDKINQWAII